MKKKLAVAGAVLCAGVMSLSFAACSDKNSDGEAEAFVSVDINPSVQLTLDSDNKVISVYGANEDGQVLLYAEEGIIGADVETAVGKITSLAVELGYLDDSNTVVCTSVTSVKSGDSEEILGKVNARISATAESLNLSVSCEGEGTYSVLRKLEQVKAQYPDNSAIQSLTADRFKLVVAATETGGISLEAAAELDTAKLIGYVSEKHQQAEEFATAAYNQAKSLASAAYDEAVGAAMDGIYTAYYTSKHPLNAYYGVSYQSYKYSARSLYAVSDALVYAEKACEYPLSETQIAAAAEALGLGADVDALKNSDGEITVNSIYAYADKLFKNSNAAAELESVKTELNAALDSVEAELKEKIAGIAAEYETELNAIKTKLNGAAEQLENMIALVPETVKEQIRTMSGDCKEITAQITEILGDGRITADEIRSLAVTLDGKAMATLEKIENDLTDEELAEVRQLQEDAMTRLSDAKAKMESAVSAAETKARAKLEELKAARRAS